MPPIGALILLAIYGTGVVAIVVFVQAIVSISDAFIGISRNLEEIATAARALS